LQKCFSPRCTRGRATLAGMPRPEIQGCWDRHRRTPILSEGLFSVAAPRRGSKAHRAKRIEQSYRGSAYSFLPHASCTAALVLCLNMGRTYTFHCRSKRPAGFEIVGFVFNVLFLSALNLTLNQRVRCLLWPSNSDPETRRDVSGLPLLTA